MFQRISDRAIHINYVALAIGRATLHIVSRVYKLHPGTTYVSIRCLQVSPLQWRHDECNGVLNHDCLLNSLFKRRSKKTPKLRVTGLCEGNSPVTGEFPSQRSSNAENVSIWWRHHVVNKITTKWHEYIFHTMDILRGEVYADH